MQKGEGSEIFELGLRYLMSHRLHRLHRLFINIEKHGRHGIFLDEHAQRSRSSEAQRRKESNELNE